MPKFKPYNYDQTSMVVINYRDQLQPGKYEYAIHYLEDNKLDLSVCNDPAKAAKTVGGVKLTSYVVAIIGAVPAIASSTTGLSCSYFKFGFHK